MNQLSILIHQLESQIPNFEKTNMQVSQVSVGWHIEHSLLTINKIIYAVSKSNPSEYRWSFKLPRLIIFTLNKIPRGKAKAPKVVLPSSSISQDSLIHQIEDSKAIIQKLESIEPNKFFTHPYFGDLKLKQTIKCLEIHTKHHLDIIKDILK